MGENAASGLVERDYSKKALTEAEIREIFGDDEILPFLNSRHAIFKERRFGSQLPPVEELIQLIIGEPNLLRRPILRRGRNFVIGFDQEAIRALI
jgi:arsenate reductase-like glutaredoxin family protein